MLELDITDQLIIPRPAGPSCLHGPVAGAQALGDRGRVLVLHLGKPGLQVQLWCRGCHWCHCSSGSRLSSPHVKGVSYNFIVLGNFLCNKVITVLVYALGGTVTFSTMSEYCECKADTENRTELYWPQAFSSLGKFSIMSEKYYKDLYASGNFY